MSILQQLIFKYIGPHQQIRLNFVNLIFHDQVVLKQNLNNTFSTIVD